MSLLEWKESYDTGIESIDTQHRRLLEIINRLHDSMKDMKSDETVDRTLLELLDYAEYHFSHEEELMARANYRKRTEHMLEHTEYVEKITEFTQEIGKGRILLSMDIINYLQDWLISHINGSDRGYITAFKFHEIN